MPGLILFVAGGTFAPISYFVIGSGPVTVLGLLVAMLGFTCIALASARLPVSPEAYELMLRAEMQNTAALLEELDFENSAVYLPSAMTGGSAKALMRLAAGKGILEPKAKVPARLVVRHGRDPGDMAISVTTAGSMAVDLLETKPGLASSEIEAPRIYVLVDTLAIATPVVVRMTDDVLT